MEVLNLHLENKDSSTSTSEKCENLFLPAFASSFSSFRVYIYKQYFFEKKRNQVSNRKYLQELIKKRSEVHQKNALLEHAISFDKSLVIVCLQNYRKELLFVTFNRVIQTRKRYVTSLTK